VRLRGAAMPEDSSGRRYCSRNPRRNPRPGPQCVDRVEQFGCTELGDGEMTYGVELMLADGRQLIIDVQAIGVPGPGQ